MVEEQWEQTLKEDPVYFTAFNETKSRFQRKGNFERREREGWVKRATPREREMKRTIAEKKRAERI